MIPPRNAVHRMMDCMIYSAKQYEIYKEEFKDKSTEEIDTFLDRYRLRPKYEEQSFRRVMKYIFQTWPQIHMPNSMTDTEEDIQNRVKFDVARKALEERLNLGDS